MNFDSILPIGLTFGGAVAGYLIRLYIAKKTAEEGTAGRFATSEFLDRIRSIDAFLKKQEIKDIIEIGRQVNLKDLSDFFKVNQSIEEHLKTFADQLHTISRLIDQQVFNEVNGRIHRYIEDNSKFIQRLDEAKSSKVYLAKNILKTPTMCSIIEDGDPIFIESGSTFAYMILPIIDFVKDMHMTSRTKPLTICTNNVIIYIILLFEESFAPFLLPGKPTNQYAATFGDAIKTDIFNESETAKFLEQHGVRTIFSTASFLDINYGPHVSSFPNLQMKRFLNKYSSDKKCKNIFVITSEKINNNISDRSTKQDCKLIFNNTDSDQVSCQDLSKDDLEKVKSNFRHFLMNDNNFIVTASTDSKLCAHQVSKLRNNFPNITRKWSIELDSGILSVINANMHMR